MKNHGLRNDGGIQERRRIKQDYKRPEKTLKTPPPASKPCPDQAVNKLVTVRSTNAERRRIVSRGLTWLGVTPTEGNHQQSVGHESQTTDDRMPSQSQPIMISHIFPMKKKMLLDIRV